ncbi:MAG: hypothetical protein ACRCVX_15500 [Shewanella sp.]
MNDQFTTTLAKFSSNVTYVSAGGTLFAWLKSAELWVIVGGLCAVFGAWSTHHYNKKRYRLEEKKAKLLGVVVDTDKADLPNE